MIEYVVFHNPDDRILSKAKNVLDNGGVIVLPTDTNWIVAADPYNKKGMEKLYRLRHADKQKHFSLLCHDIALASELAHIDNQAYKILKRIIPGHYTFIFEASKKITKAIQASKTDKEVGIRFVPSDFVNKVIELMGCPLISANITHEMLEISEEEPIYPYLIEENLRGFIDLILDPGEVDFVGSSTIIDFSSENAPELIRRGAGDYSLFE